MPKSPIIYHNSTGFAAPDNTTSFMPPMGGSTYDADLHSTTLELIARGPIRLSGDLTNMWAYVSANGCDVTSTLTFRQNQADELGLQVSYTSLQTGVQADDTGKAVIDGATEDE